MQRNQAMCSSPVEPIPNDVILLLFSTPMTPTWPKDNQTSAGGKVTHRDDPALSHCSHDPVFHKLLQQYVVINDWHIMCSECINVLFYPSVEFFKSPLTFLFVETKPVSVSVRRTRSVCVCVSQNQTICTFFEDFLFQLVQSNSWGTIPCKSLFSTFFFAPSAQVSPHLNVSKCVLCVPISLNLCCVAPGWLW